MPGGQFWVTWPDIPDKSQARARALIWGPQANPPPQVTSPVRMFLGGPFASQADAQKYKDAIGSPNPLPPGGTPIVGSAGRGVTQTVQNAVGALTSVPELLSRLTSINTWIRVGEFVIGAALILAGALRLSGQSSDLGDVVKIATKVVK